MKPKKIAINGFGRIGRLAARTILSNYADDIEIIAVNDLASVENLAYLLQYDTTYRKFDHIVSVTNNNEISIVSPSGKESVIKVFSQKEPSYLPWKELEIDVVLECTGLFLTKEMASQHIHAGAKKVILSAPAKSDDIPTIVLGINRPHMDWNIISNASCTTNCIAPALNLIKNEYAIQSAVALTAHAVTATQVVQDGPSKKAFRDGRSSAYNLIPSTSGASKAVEKVLPVISGKLIVDSLRVPVITGSMVHLCIHITSETTPDRIRRIFEEAAQKYPNIYECSAEELVSSDIIGNSHSCILDSSLTEVLGNTVKLVLWYDNEWGYTQRLVQLLTLV